MTDEEFDEHIAATETREDGTVGGLDYCCLKLAAEAGEVAGLRGKEILVQGCPPDIERRAAYALELGDVLWYLHEAYRLLGLTADQVKRLNIMKLRYRRILSKDPKQELQAAINFLTLESEKPPTAATKPVECMAQHSYAEGCPLVCGTPTNCGKYGCSRALRSLLDAAQVRVREHETPEEFLPCVFCHDLTRHTCLVMLPPPEGGALRRPLCKAPACRRRRDLGDSVPA